jgi:hypothetical protein
VSVIMISGKKYAQFVFPRLGKTVQVRLIMPTEIKNLKKGAHIENVYPDEEPEGYTVKIKSKEVDLEDGHFMIALTFENNKDESRESTTGPGVSNRESSATLLTLSSTSHPHNVTLGAISPTPSSSLSVLHEL